jgi:membrane protein DedA with SNARE-associated domain
MLDLVEKLFSRYGIRSLRYDGSMDRHARETALSTFKRVGGPKVILIRWVMRVRKLVCILIGLDFSTRCGGVGLK